MSYGMHSLVPHPSIWSRARLFVRRGQLGAGILLIAPLAAAGAVVWLNRTHVPARPASVPASLRHALAARAGLGSDMELILPVAEGSRMGRRASPGPDGMLVFEERPCFFVTPQTSFVPHGDVRVEYRDRGAFEDELEPWVRDRASARIPDLASGTLQLWGLRRTDGLAVPDPAAPCNFDTERPDTVVLSELSGEASFLGWQRRAGGRALPASAASADISVAGEALRLGASLSEVRTVRWNGAVALEAIAEGERLLLADILAAPRLPGWIEIEAHDAARRELTLRFETPTNEEANPLGMPLEDRCRLGVRRALRPGEGCRFVPGRGDTLVVLWNDDPGSEPGGARGAPTLRVSAFRTEASRSAATTGGRP